MRSKVFAALGLAGIFIIGACSSSEKPKAQTNSSESANSANSNTVVVTNGMVISPQPGDPNANSTAATNAVPLQMQGKLNKMGRGEGSIDPAAVALRNAKPAPDNSTFASYLTDYGYEIRTFKNHPQLLKVEKVIENSGNQTIKIYLRSGKVLQLPGQKIPVLSTAPAATIVEAAGLSPAPQKEAPAGSTGSKKPGD